MTGRLRAASLRVRLLLGLLVLAAIGLGAADVVGLQVLRHSQLSRIDEQLAGFDGRARPPSGTTGTLAQSLCVDRSAPPPAGRRGPNTFVQECLSPTGTVLSGDLGLSSLAPPRVPALTLATARARGGKPFTVPATTGGGQWRVVASPLADGSGVLVAGVSLRELRSTTDQLLAIDLAVSGAVLVLLLALGYAVVRVGLRPLAAVTATADAIAAGELDRRVPVPDPRTEVGRLGTAFNAMLERIQTALDERDRTAAQLRQFAADASHELRTPLTSIRGFAELHRVGAIPPGPGLDRAMGRIEDEAVRMGGLVEDLLTLARLDRGPSLEVGVVDLGAIVDDAVHDARAVDPDRPISVASTGPVVVRGDDGGLRQVATNLLANARAHTPPGTAVRVRTYLDGPDAVLEVADSGPGLPAEQAARVFDRFWRADPSRNRSSGGTGLGLSIVASIAAAHGGSAEVLSTPGDGAVFRVRLPR